MRRFNVCIHDATPAYARETRVMLQDLAPLLGHRLSFGVVPNWYGEWPLTAHPEYCRLIQEASEELLLHGYFHQRQRGRGPIALLTDRCDEMNGLDLDETRRTIERGQHVFTEALGEPARGFLAPAWQLGRVRLASTSSMRQGRPEGRHYDRRGQGRPEGRHYDRRRRGRPEGRHYDRRHYDSRSAGLQAGLDYVVGFSSVQSAAGREVPLATWSWDSGRWGWLGHLGHGVGWLSQSLDRGVPTLAIHPRDLEHGFWPTIVRLIQPGGKRFRPVGAHRCGYEPATVAGLLESHRC
jgi:peptidoglycan/xylan/chitin deacetylase (PgdA/CDA1 family)